MNILVKRHTGSGGLVLALCDADVLGKTFSDAHAEITVGTYFFGGESLTLHEIQTLLAEAYTINAVGEEAVALLVQQSLIVRQDVKKIGRLPYAMVMRF